MPEQEEKKAKNPKRVEQGNKLASMDKDYYGGKPGPKTHLDSTCFFKYILPRMEKERSSIQWFIDYYKKQPFFLRSQIAQSDEFNSLLWTLQADIALGNYKPTREQWQAMSGIFQRLGKLASEREKTKRKVVSKESAKRNRAGTEGMTGLVIEAENENE